MSKHCRVIEKNIDLRDQQHLKGLDFKVEPLGSRKTEERRRRGQGVGEEQERKKNVRMSKAGQGHESPPMQAGGTQKHQCHGLWGLIGRFLNAN